MRGKLYRDKSRMNLFVRAALAFTAAAVALILVLALIFSRWESLASAMEASKFELGLWRLSLFLLLISGWPVFTDKYADWVGLTTEETASLKAYRWRMAVWLLVMEVLFCQTLWLGFAWTLVEMVAWAT